MLEKAPETKKTKPKPKLQFSFQGLGKCPCCAVPRADETHVARCQATKAKSADKNVQQPLEFETPASRDGGSAASSVHKKNPTPPSPRVESGKRKQKNAVGGARPMRGVRSFVCLACPSGRSSPEAGLDGLDWLYQPHVIDQI